MDRGAQQATVHGITKVGHNLATKLLAPPCVFYYSQFLDSVRTLTLKLIYLAMNMIVPSSVEQSEMESYWIIFSVLKSYLLWSGELTMIDLKQRKEETTPSVLLKSGSESFVELNDI